MQRAETAYHSNHGQSSRPQILLSGVSREIEEVQSCHRMRLVIAGHSERLISSVVFPKVLKKQL